MSNPFEIVENPVEPIESDRHHEAERLQTDYNEAEGQENFYFSAYELKKWLHIGIVYLFTFILLMIWSYGSLPLQVAGIPLIIGDFKNIIYSLIRLNHSANYQKRIYYKEIVENFGTLLTKLLVVAYLVNPQFLISFALIPLFLSSLLNLFIKSISFTKCQTFSEIIFIILRIARLLSAISIALEIDGIYSLSLGLALWPVWSFLGVLGILSIGLLIYSIGICCTYNYRSGRLEILSTFWLLYISIGSLISFSILFISISNDSPSFIPPCVFFAIYVLLTSLLFSDLKAGLSVFFSEDQEVTGFSRTMPSDLHPQTRNQPSPLSLGRKIIRALKTPPRTLIQLSHSYFKRAPDVRTTKKRTSSVLPAAPELCFQKRWNTATPRKRVKTDFETDPNTVDVDKCLMCMEKYTNAVFMECGHGGVCFDCAVKVERESGLCHICRAEISQVLKVFKIPGGVIEVISENGTAWCN